MAVVDDEPKPLIGKGHPPAGSRFRKGQSGNPRGRPRGSRRLAPYEATLGQMVTVREEGTTRQMTAAEAFLLHITRKGLEGDSAAARAAMVAIEDARARKGTAEHEQVRVIIVSFLGMGSVGHALKKLRAAVKLDPLRPTARMAIEPWLVEKALARLGDRRLSKAEQRTVWKATRTPWKVAWPGWWEWRG